MELSEKYNNKIIELQKALQGFADTTKIDLFSFTEIVADTLKNGQVQKIEYCSELLWKTVKLFLEEKHGVIASSPKNVFRELFKNNYIDEKSFEKLVQLVNNRNSLSHIDNENYFEEVHKHLPEHLELMQLVVEKITE